MLVSQAPNQLAKQTPAENKPGGIPFDRRAINQRWDRLRIEGWKWRPAWRDIRDFIAPSRGFFEYENPNWGRKINHERILNDHATDASNKLAAGMTSGMTSPSRPWFALGTTDPDLADFEPVKEWLSTVHDRMYAVMSKSNIYQVWTNLYGEIGAFGTAAEIILPDYHSVIRGRNFTAGEYFLGQGSDNRVNAFARQYWLSVGQMVQEFGLENCSQYVQAAYRQNNVDQWRLIRHLIEVNDDRVMDRRDFKGKAFRSIQWEEGASSQIALKVSGFEEFPVQAPRWQRTTQADSYGRGPGWFALGDVKMLQRMEKDALKALDKVVDPPVQADASVDIVNTLPGGLTRYSATTPSAGVKPVYMVQPDFKSIGEMIKRVEQRIDAKFFVDLWTMISDLDRSGVTAEEIVEKKTEKMQMLGPVIESLEFEVYDPAIDRIFNIMQRAGLIPPPPADLQGHELKIEYISILAQAQKMVGTTAIEQTARFAGGLVAVSPEAVDLLDTDEAIRKYATMTGVPPKIIRTPDKVAEIRNARRKQQQAEAAAQAAERTVEGAKTLSETKVGENSALDQIMGTQGGVPGTTSAAPAR